MHDFKCEWLTLNKTKAPIMKGCADLRNQNVVVFLFNMFLIIYFLSLDYCWLADGINYGTSLTFTLLFFFQSPTNS